MSSYIGPAPVLTTTQRGALTSPAEGLIIYNSTNARLEIQTGSPASPNWIQLPLTTSPTPGYQHNDVAVANEINLDFEDSSTIGWTVTDDSANTRVKVTPAFLTNSAVTGSLYWYNGSSWKASANVLITDGSGNITANGTGSILYAVSSQYGSATIGGDGSHAGWQLSNAGTFYSSHTATNNSTLITSVNGDTVARLVIGADGKQSYSDGSHAADTIIARGGSGILNVTNTVNAISGYQVNGVALSSSNLSDGTTGTGSIVLANGSNPIPVSIGGTGATTLTSHGILLGAGTGAITALAVGTSGQLLQSAGNANPAWTTSTYPGTAGAAGHVPRSNGTNYVDAALSASDVTNAADKSSASTQTFTASVSALYFSGPAIYKTSYDFWTGGGTITPNLNNGNYQIFELTDSGGGSAGQSGVNFALPSNPPTGHSTQLVIALYTSSTAIVGDTITWTSSAYKGAGQTLPAAGSGSAGNTIAVSFTYDGSVWICTNVTTAFSGGNH